MLNLNKQFSSESFNSDSISQTNSTLSSRITRKPIDRSKSRKSNSRQHSSGSSENESIGRFYIKMNNQGNDFQRTNCMILSKKTQPVISKFTPSKRQPTPQLGKGLKQHNYKKNVLFKRQTSIDIENEILISELQKQNAQEKQKCQIYEKRAITFEKEIKNKLKEILSLKRQIQDIKKRQNSLIAKLLQIQARQKEKQQSYTQAKHNLQKLKKIIQQNRIEEMAAQNTRLIKHQQAILLEKAKVQSENIRLANENQKLKRQIAILQHSLNQNSLAIFYEGQIQDLRKINSKSKSQSYLMLEDLIKRKDQELFNLNLKMSKLQVKVNYINRKKNEEIENLRLKKQKQFMNLRCKFATTLRQLSQLRKQTEKLRRKNNLFMSTHLDKNVIINSPRAYSLDYSDGDISFDLSSEQNDL